MILYSINMENYTLERDGRELQQAGKNCEPCPYYTLERDGRELQQCGLIDEYHAQLYP